ncbi:Envoplakin [Oryzias melastigma]|uniref:Envoplakin n=2 Tax=Oryzias melastigma TaxID=30732 RepID=A0A834F6S1_ORYME|nr:Envoplakin [Oryzias melastigma]
MSKKKELSSAKISRSQATDLAAVIARMQKNADQVEKNVLRVEDLLAVDTERQLKGRLLFHQKENADNLAQAEDLLKNLFLDVDKAKKLKHPQSNEIERDVKNLHDRWVKDCTAYRDLYDPVQDLELTPKIDWELLFQEKLSQLQSDYGPKVSDVEKQIAEHNILHKELEAYGDQLQPSSIPSKENYSSLKDKHSKLLESSKFRQTHLASLYEYLQGCTKELVYLSSQQEKILHRDYSDRMVDPAGVSTEYEKLKSNSLLTHEGEVNRLQDDGDRLMDAGHPGGVAIQVHKDTVQAEWQAFLNLCLTQETHLDNINFYKQFQLDAETLSHSLERLSSTLDPKSLRNKSNSEILLALEGEEPSLRRNEQRLVSLKERSSSVPPLKLRRVQPRKPTPVFSLCDWTDEEEVVRRGEHLTLKSFFDGNNWELQDTSGKIKTLPGVCFMIPPPDAEALETIDRLDRRLADLKSQRAALMASLRSPVVEVDHPQKTAVLQSSPEDLKAAELLTELERINRALDKCEEQILNRLRAPLDNRSPTQDLAKRQREHEKSAATVRALESEKSSIQRQLDPILAKKPLGPTASILPPKLNSTDNKIENIETLMNLYNKKATASMFLEKQIQHVEDLLSGFEKKLVEDGTILNKPSALEDRKKEIQDMQTDVFSAKEELVKLGKDLDLTKKACSSVQQTAGEYCPDIQRQENTVKQLKNRYANIKNQLQYRLALLQQAINKSRDFQNAVSSLDYALFNLPNNSAKSTDDFAQIKAKEKSQQKVVEDIEKKTRDLAQIKDLSKDLQRLLNEYDMKSVTYHRSLNDEDDSEDDQDEDPVITMSRTLAQRVQRTERELQNLFSEVSAENKERLIQLQTAKNIMARNEESISQVVVSQQLQLQNQMVDQQESESLKKELGEEINRRLCAERDLETYHKRFVSLKSRRGVERLEEKEVVQYFRDPQLESELRSLKNKIQDEDLKRSKIQTEIHEINEKMIKTEIQLTKVEPKLVTKVLTEYERDPKLDKEAAKIRDEMQQIKQELKTRESETIHVKTELTLLTEQKPKIREKIMKKEVVRLEKDPEMLKAVLVLKNLLEEEKLKRESLNNDIILFSTRSTELERIIPTIQPKTVTKVVKQVQQDPEMLEESRKLKMLLEEEKDENVILMKDLTTLKLQYAELERLKPKVEVKEITHEIYRLDPETEVELLRLKKELQDLGRGRTNVETEIDEVLATLVVLRKQKPKVEYKEITQEVIKEEKSPEVVRELQRLNNQATRLRVNCDTTLELLAHLRKERDELKADKSKVETKLVTKELIKYEDDPLLLKEADRLRRDVREEIQQRRFLEECLFDLQNQYISLEREKPEEKIISKPVVRYQNDPQQIQQHERLNRNLDEETKARRKLELEVRRLRGLVQDKESLSKSDDRQRKIQVEAELRNIRARILELENAPPPVEEKIIIEEVLKVEKDPKLEKLTADVRTNLETENIKISDLERELRNLEVRLELLQKEKSLEKVVYREVIRVEKDPSVEAERDRLRDLVSKERNHRRDQEENVQRITMKINQLNTSKPLTCQEEATIISQKEALQKEKEDLLKQLKALESQRSSINITFQQQSRLLSERNQLAHQKSLKTSSELQRLEKQILNEKDKIHQKETLIAELLSSIKKEEHSETQTRETNLSTKITILDPETGKDMSPYDAYLLGLIERDQYLKLAELECDWEEITSHGPDGDTSILLDRKSGKQYSIMEALKDGRLTEADLKRYKERKMPISEFALLVAGEKPSVPLPQERPPKTIPTTPTSPLNSMLPSLRSSQTNLSSHLNGSLNDLSGGVVEEHFPISGIFDTTTESRMSVRSAMTRKLIDAETGLKLLEAQAASGGIVDLRKKDKMSVHKAVQNHLIDSSQMHKLLNAQKAFTGVEDPVSKVRLSTSQAAQKGYIPPENAKRYLEAQYLTGGLVNPSKPGRLTIQEALATKMIDSKTAEELQDEASHTKELVDPITKEKISYKQAMDRCKTDHNTGLLLLPAASTGADNTPSYSNYRFNSPYSKV